MRLQKMSQGTLLPLTLEEDLGLSNLATKNDQRTFAWFCHLELIRYELGFLGNLDEELLVPPHGALKRHERCSNQLGQRDSSRSAEQLPRVKEQRQIPDRDGYPHPPAQQKHS